jgi:hypothetical protein
MSPQQPSPQSSQAGDSSSLKLSVNDLGEIPERVPHRATGRPRGRPKGSSKKPDLSFLPECPHCHGRFKYLSQHIGECVARPGGPASAQPTIKIEITADSLAIVIAGGFDILAAQRGPYWRLDPLEAQALGLSWKQAIDAYFPDLAQSKAGILVLALIQTWAVLGPRMKRDAARGAIPPRTPGPGAGGDGKNDVAAAAATAVAA